MSKGKGVKEKEGVCYFDLQKNSVIWIYGAGNKGEKFCKNLMEAGYQVAGFLDNRANSLTEIYGRRVVPPYEATRFVSQEDVVIISLENGLQQEWVAEKLAAEGLRKLIYLPMHIKQSLLVRRQYRENYACLLESDFEHIKRIPIFGCETTCQECVIIRQEYARVAFWCKISELHTATFEDMSFALKKWNMNQNILRQYADRKIEEMQPYIELFQYLKGEDADLTSYMEMQGRLTREQREQLLNDRKMLYLVYEQAYKYEMNFFADSPSECTWNEKGYFNIQDGMHRAIYLISKGYTEIPIVATKGDFEKYISK